MAYDKQKAHEYYENYTKKGKLKGRKKGKGKSKSEKTTKLVGLSTAGLNDEGKMEFALMKDKLQTEMNAAMKKASTQSEKDAIRLQYQQRALQEISKLKSDPKLQKQKAAKSSTAKSSDKSSGSSKSSGGSSSKGSSSSGKKSGSSSSGSKNSSSASQEQKLNDIKTEIQNLTEAIKSVTEEQKELVKNTINLIMEKLAGVTSADATSLLTSLESLTKDTKKTEAENGK